MNNNPPRPPRLSELFWIKPISPKRAVTTPRRYGAATLILTVVNIIHLGSVQQMRRIAARGIVTRMHYHHPMRNIHSRMYGPGNPVCINTLATTIPQSSVSTFCPSPAPFPTIIHAKAIDMLPKLFNDKIRVHGVLLTGRMEGAGSPRPTPSLSHEGVDFGELRG